MQIHEFVDEGLGHSSYVIDLGDGTAAIVDPPRFPTAHEQLADRARACEIAWTIDTHSHADYVTGSPGLVARRDARRSSRPRHRTSRHRTARSSTASIIELAAGDHADRAGDAGPHARSPRLRADRSRRAGGVVHRWFADGRHRRPDRSVRPRTGGAARARDVPRVCAASTPCPTTSPSTRRTVPGRSARRRARRSAPPPSATNAPRTRCSRITRRGRVRRATRRRVRHASPPTSRGCPS